jgi:glycine/D-amino acid oxidase-like deaminating enzyme
MQPLDYALAVAREIERLGGKVFENAPALSTGRFGASHLVATPRGKVSAPAQPAASTSSWLAVPSSLRIR